MAKKKVEPQIEEKVEETLPEVVEEPQVEEAPEVGQEESEAKKKFRQLIEKYKVQNPVKYAQKEEEFIRKLNTL